MKQNQGNGAHKKKRAGESNNNSRRRRWNKSLLDLAVTSFRVSVTVFLIRTSALAQLAAQTIYGSLVSDLSQEQSGHDDLRYKTLFASCWPGLATVKSSHSGHIFEALRLSAVKRSRNEGCGQIFIRRCGDEPDPDINNRLLTPYFFHTICAQTYSFGLSYNNELRRV